MKCWEGRRRLEVVFGETGAVEDVLRCDIRVVGQAGREGA